MNEEQTASLQSALHPPTLTRVELDRKTSWRRQLGRHLLRLFTQRTLFASRRQDARFVERWVSGRSGTGLVARFATVRNCLQAQIAPEGLLVQPHFPFTLGFMPELYDLDKNVPLSALRSAIIAGVLARRWSK